MEGLIIVCLLWGEVQVSESSNLDLFPHIVSVEGNYIVEWEGVSESGSFEIYVRALDSDCNPISTPLKVSEGGAGHRLNGTIISSGDGAMVSWINHQNKKVYAIKVNSQGDIHEDWQPPYHHPVEVYTSYDLQTPAVCEDGHGGAVFVWVTYNETTKKYYLIATRLNASGENPNPEIWPDTLLTASYTLKMPKITGNDKAVVAWVEEQRRQHGDHKETARVFKCTVLNVETGEPGAFVVIDEIWKKDDGDKGYHNYAARKIMSYDFVVDRDVNDIYFVWNYWFTVEGKWKERIYFKKVDLISSTNTMEPPSPLIIVAENAPTPSDPRDSNYMEFFTKFKWARVGGKNGIAYVTYSEGITSKQVKIAKIFPLSGVAWNKAVNVNTAYSNNVNPKIFINEDDYPIVLWTRNKCINFDEPCNHSEAVLYGVKIDPDDGDVLDSHPFSSNTQAWSFDFLVDGTDVIGVWNGLNGNDWNIYVEKVSF